mmetsp:Transcript_5947/g.11713  ORF Transcript_5947/g.11713 Transcript_5947/m.11713 type:complete len:101 (-) Transcript_5947:2180-2482(-)
MSSQGATSPLQGATSSAATTTSPPSISVRKLGGSRKIQASSPSIPSIGKSEVRLTQCNGVKGQLAFVILRSQSGRSLPCSLYECSIFRSRIGFKENGALH